MSWEESRKELQRLESELDAKLITYSKIGTSVSNSSLLGASLQSPTDVQSHQRQRSSFEADRDIEAEAAESALSDQRMSESIRYDIEQLLKKTVVAVDEAASWIHANPSAPSLARMQLQRHQEKLLDYRQQYQRIRKSIQESRDHAELLSFVRDDISHHKNSTRTSLLLRERSSLQNTERALDDTLGQAQAARESLTSQRHHLSSIGGKVTYLAGNAIPLVRGLLSDIRRRKKRDQYILAGVIGFCIFLIYLYIMH